MRARQDYDDGEGSGDDHHDYHHDTHCTDVSAWSEVKWIEKETVNCTTIFMKEQKWKNEKVTVQEFFFDFLLLDISMLHLKISFYFVSSSNFRYATLLRS